MATPGGIRFKGPVAAVAVTVPLLLGLALGLKVRGELTESQPHRMSSECRLTLQRLSVAQQALYARAQRYTADLDELKVELPPSNRYVYLLGLQGTLRSAVHPGPGPHNGLEPDLLVYPSLDVAQLRGAVPAAVAQRLGVTGTCPDCSVTMACAGNVDEDATIDVWSVTSVAHPGVAAWALVNDVDDATR
jgi:hypothetical protein